MELHRGSFRFTELAPFHIAHSAVIARQFEIIAARMRQKEEKSNSLPRLFGRTLVGFYRYTLSPLIGPRCRHLPSCSEYADEAIGRFGLWPGSWMALARIARCHPWGTYGLDFVPHARPVSARWWKPWRYGRWRGTQTEP